MWIPSKVFTTSTCPLLQPKFFRLKKSHLICCMALWNTEHRNGECLLQVCDSLLNIGPCGNISMGEPAFLSEEFSNIQDPDIELFTTSGYGKNGALCVLQRSVRPQVQTCVTWIMLVLLSSHVTIWNFMKTLVLCRAVDCATKKLRRMV